MQFFLKKAAKSLQVIVHRFISIKFSGIEKKIQNFARNYLKLSFRNSSKKIVPNCFFFIVSPAIIPKISPGNLPEIPLTILSRISLEACCKISQIILEDFCRNLDYINLFFQLILKALLK